MPKKLLETILSIFPPAIGIFFMIASNQDKPGTYYLGIIYFVSLAILAIYHLSSMKLSHYFINMVMLLLLPIARLFTSLELPGADVVTTVGEFGLLFFGILLINEVATDKGYNLSFKMTHFAFGMLLIFLFIILFIDQVHWSLSLIVTLFSFLAGLRFLLIAAFVKEEQRKLAVFIVVFLMTPTIQTIWDVLNLFY